MPPVVRSMTVEATLVAERGEERVAEERDGMIANRLQRNGNGRHRLADDVQLHAPVLLGEENRARRCGIGGDPAHGRAPCSRRARCCSMT